MWSVSHTARNEKWHVDDNCFQDTKMRNPWAWATRVRVMKCDHAVQLCTCCVLWVYCAQDLIDASKARWQRGLGGRASDPCKSVPTADPSSFRGRRPRLWWPSGEVLPKANAKAGRCKPEHRDRAVISGLHIVAHRDTHKTPTVKSRSCQKWETTKTRFTCVCDDGIVSVYAYVESVSGQEKRRLGRCLRHALHRWMFAVHTASEVCPLVNGRTALKKKKKNKGKAILCSKSSNFTVNVTAPLGSRSKRLWSSRGCVRLSVGHTKCLPLLDTPASQHIVSTVNMYGPNVCHGGLKAVQCPLRSASKYAWPQTQHGGRPARTKSKSTKFWPGLDGNMYSMNGESVWRKSGASVASISPMVLEAGLSFPPVDTVCWISGSEEGQLVQVVGNVRLRHLTKMNTAFQADSGNAVECGSSGSDSAPNDLVQLLTTKNYSLTSTHELQLTTNEMQLTTTTTSLY